MQLQYVTDSSSRFSVFDMDGNASISKMKAECTVDCSSVYISVNEPSDAPGGWIAFEFLTAGSTYTVNLISALFDGYYAPRILNQTFTFCTS